MKPVRVLTMFVAGIALLAVPRMSAAQDKTARGVVSAVAADSVTVTAQGQAMTFTVGRDTVVVAHGALTKAHESQPKGSDVKLDRVVTKGQTVVVTYQQAGAAMHATRVQVLEEPRAAKSPAVAQARRSAADSADSKIARGVVKAVTGTSLTVTADGGTDLTFSIDSHTTVVARGAGTRMAATGGKMTITDEISTGNRVTVTYQDMNGMLHATSVRRMP